MSRIQEKVKDIIEVCPYESPVDLQADPALTLSTYHFTDVTAELMAKWLDDLNGVRNDTGRMKALAGYRGVGKSHFLATFGAVLAYPELRTRIKDAHVASSAQLLMRRHYPVAHVRRGTRATLVEELRDAVALTLSVDLAETPESLEEILSFIDMATSEVPFVLIFDTAYERASRVARDDGVMLGRLSEIAGGYNIFVGIALDDDITEADGMNVAISRHYSIDYLDQSHLHRIVNAHIFPKNRQSQGLLDQIYRYFREVSPGFHWSEQSFKDLYPLHPTILEVAPFIRLYATNFALFGFASDAGERILGRPASSLISLDEVFDNVEHRLRKSEELTEAFEIYDKISKEIVSLIPVMQRLQAKLILKALFILSLDGDGTTAAEISAAMLIYDEKDPQKAIRTVDELLETIVSIFPDDLIRKSDEGGETRFSLKVGGKDKLNTALEEAVRDISRDHVPTILRRVAKDRLPDWNLSVDGKEEMEIWTDCQIRWRGSFRRCRLYWNWDNRATEVLEGLDIPDYLDLEIFINNPEAAEQPLQQNAENPRAVWRPAALTREEIGTILRFYVLLNNEELRTAHPEQVRAAGHTHSLQIEKIWERVFFKDARIIVEGEEFGFTEEIREKQTLGELLSENLGPFFGKMYPEHPDFDAPLGMNEVSRLVNDLFSGARKTHEGIQQLAESFALPLGLVSHKGDTYVLETEENLYRLPWVEKVLALISENEGSTVSLKTIYRRLKEKPYGLNREAQHLILAALVAARKVEFVTTNGDRIGRRSLDLKIIWDDISGIAKPADLLYGSRRLTEWAKLVTEVEGAKNIDVAADRELVKESLRQWLENWNKAAVLDRFGEVSDEVLNTKIWYISVNVEKTFGSVAGSIQSYFDDMISLEVCLQRIADAFSDSDEEFRLRRKDLVTLVSFIRNAADRQQIWGYLAVCERTADAEIERHREELLGLLEETASAPTSDKNKRMEQLWKEFQALYSEHFAVKHDAIMRSHQLQEKFDEILKSEEWWEFQNLSKLPVFHPGAWKEAQRIIRQFEELDCRFDVRELLTAHPFCGCSFNLMQMRSWEMLPGTLSERVAHGLLNYRRTLSLLGEELARLLERYIGEESDPQLQEAARELAGGFTSGDLPERFSTEQMNILHKIIGRLDTARTVGIAYPENIGLVSAEELRQQLNGWIDQLPSGPVFVQVRPN